MGNGLWGGEAGTVGVSLLYLVSDALFVKGIVMQAEESIIKVEYGIDTTIVTLGAERILEEQQIKELSDSVMPVIEKNKDGKLILNFSNVEFMSSSLLGLLIKVHKRVCEMGGHLQLININSNIYKVFEITRLTKVFDIEKA